MTLGDGSRKAIIITHEMRIYAYVYLQTHFVVKEKMLELKNVCGHIFMTFILRLMHTQYTWTVVQ